jgi:hypothetical protein
MQVDDLYNIIESNKIQPVIFAIYEDTMKNLTKSYKQLIIHTVIYWYYLIRKQ